MKKKSLQTTIIGVGLMTLSATSLFAHKPVNQNSFPSSDLYLKECVSKTIQTNSQLDVLKNDLQVLLDELYRTGHVSKTESDANVRPSFVTLQGVMEQTLALELQKGKIKNLVGIIHTPTPTTPLCTKGEISSELVDESLLQDENRLYTVRSRVSTVRDFLNLGGELYVVYPKGGLEKRTEEQQEIYQEALNTFATLHDYELPVDSIRADMIGACYLFEDEAGQEYLFSIKAYQANAPIDNNAWSIWYGKTSNSQISNRLSELREFLNECQGPGLKIKGA